MANEIRSGRGEQKSFPGSHSGHVADYRIYGVIANLRHYPGRESLTHEVSDTQLALDNAAADAQREENVNR